MAWLLNHRVVEVWQYHSIIHHLQLRLRPLSWLFAALGVLQDVLASDVVHTTCLGWWLLQYVLTVNTSLIRRIEHLHRSSSASYWLGPGKEPRVLLFKDFVGLIVSNRTPQRLWLIVAGCGSKKRIHLVHIQMCCSRWRWIIGILA